MICAYQRVNQTSRIPVQLTELFVYHAFPVARLGGAAEWARENPTRLDDFRKWLPAYNWPSK